MIELVSIDYQLDVTHWVMSFLDRFACSHVPERLFGLGESTALDGWDHFLGRGS